MVGVPRPNKIPWRTANLAPIDKSCKKEAPVTVPWFAQAGLTSMYFGKIPMVAWSGHYSAVIREVIKHAAGCSMGWDRYRNRKTLQEYALSSDRPNRPKSAG